MKKDLFISHASEDKDDFVRPLADLLKEYGVDVWYDEFELRIGSSLSRSIDKGISNSKYGLLILSNSFFAKNWTEYELKSLNSFEIESADVLLPIWKDVTVEEVRTFSPYLADKFALPTDKYSLEEIVIKLIEVVNPELHSKIHQKMALEEQMKSAITETVPISEIKDGPIRHPKLSNNLISRIRLIRSSLLLCYPHSMEFWIDGFRRDINIESEIRYWEHLGACFMELILHPNTQEYHQGKEDNFYTDLFQVLMGISNLPETERKKMDKTFTKEGITRIEEIWKHILPIYDLDDMP